jgi:hypothetical protein
MLSSHQISLLQVQVAASMEAAQIIGSTLFCYSQKLLHHRKVQVIVNLLAALGALILVLGKFAIDSLINSYLEPTTSSEVPVAETFSAPIEIEISDSENLIEEVEEVAQEVIEEVEEATQEVIEEVVEQRAQEAVEKNPYITDEMLVSKKGTPLKGSSRTARINKLLSQGYILQP